MVKLINASIFLVLSFLSSQVAATISAEEVVKSTSNEVLSRLRAQRAALKAEPGRVHSLVDEIIVPHFDFVRMSRWVLGKHWRQADNQQKARFVEEFKKMLIRTYANALTDYADATVTYHPARGDSKMVLVKTEIVRSDGPSIPVDYRMHKNGEDWLVFDVLVEGVSLVSTHRDEYSEKIRQNGLEKLIDELRATNQPSS